MAEARLFRQSNYMTVIGIIAIHDHAFEADKRTMLEKAIIIYDDFSVRIATCERALWQPDDSGLVAGAILVVDAH